MSTPTTRAPSATKRRAKASPIPFPAPVTTQTLSLSRKLSPPRRSASLGPADAAVDVQHLARDERGCIRSQVDCGARDLARLGPFLRKQARLEDLAPQDQL